MQTGNANPVAKNASFVGNYRGASNQTVTAVSVSGPVNRTMETFAGFFFLSQESTSAAAIDADVPAGNYTLNAAGAGSATLALGAVSQVPIPKINNLAELAAMNRQAEIFLRVNPLRSSLSAVTAELLEQGIALSPVEGAPLALRTVGARGIPARMRLGGKFEIQDAGSQQVAPFLQVEPGQVVVDACAGAGGKTLHLAALMSGSGELHALDVHGEKLDVLNGRANRAGVSVHATVISPDILTRLDSRADRVLVDAPCSGSGTLRRQPDLKYRITAESLAGTIVLQRELLTRFARLVRPGGKLVYATCSVLPSENEEQAAWFSTQHSDFVFEEERRISPAATGWDGFYMARWRRMESPGLSAAQAFPTG